ncbi:MAG: lamin tail domain-containing protein [Chryseolinea sp.]
MKNVIQLIASAAALTFVLSFFTQQAFANPNLTPTSSINEEIGESGWKDIIFNEIFPDPSPAIGLPPSEFIELLNRSPNEINLNGWQIRDAASVMTIPEISLRPGEYLILTGDFEEYKSFGKVLGSKDFPSLNNSGDVLILQSADGVLIDSIHYTDEWYKDSERKHGGWSLELIYPENLCSDKENWIVSDDPTGGTAGKQNNVYSEKPDLSGPQLISVIAIENNSLQLVFNERLSAIVPKAGSVHVDPLIEIEKVEFMETSLNVLTISLSQPIQNSVSYSISVADVYDCAGNVIQPEFSAFIFGNPEAAIIGDVVINEILFNPGPITGDFIEVRNLSGKFINISNWSLANYVDGVTEGISLITDKDVILQPYGYLAITEDRELLLSAYPKAPAKKIINAEDLPPLNDDSGTAAIVNEQGEVIDHVHYTATMHSIFIRDPEGVSLERTFTGILSNDNWNWKSASERSGFATPGYLNSNDYPGSASPPEAVTIDPRAFIPKNGQPDYTRIQYSFEQGGYVANVKVYDNRGRLIKKIANNEILGTEGALRWDGDTEDGLKARVGYYMIWFEVFDASGNVRVIRKSVAVGAGF